MCVEGRRQRAAINFLMSLHISAVTMLNQRYVNFGCTGFCKYEPSQSSGEAAAQAISLVRCDSDMQGISKKQNFTIFPGFSSIVPSCFSCFTAQEIHCGCVCLCDNVVCDQGVGGGGILTRGMCVMG